MSEFLDLHGKVAVVTGAASGLGRAVARGLVREGARVVLGDIDKAGLERTARELGDAARWHRTDVARRDDVAALFRVCDEAFGPVEILATCAGIISSAPLAVMTEEEWDRVLAINTKGTFNTLRLAARHLRDGGRIVLDRKNTLVIASGISNGAGGALLADGAAMLQGPLGALPPLLTLERLLFRLIAAAFVLLTCTLATGFAFAETLFGQPLRFDHKTVFALLSWATFALLLAGRHFRGWRGRTALRWTLTGFVMLLLAYVGSRFVMEVLLGRS